MPGGRQQALHALLHVLLKQGGQQTAGEVGTPKRWQSVQGRAHSLAMHREELSLGPKVQRELVSKLGLLAFQVGQRIVVLPVLVLHCLPVGYVLCRPKRRGFQE